MYDPILIASAPRCGTSMIAGLLYYHGVWIGKAYGTKFAETNTELGTENVDIKNYLKEINLINGNKVWNKTPLPINAVINSDSFRERILSMVDNSGPWLVKTAGILYFPELWMVAFPNAKWLFPRRLFKHVMESFNRHPSMSKRPNKEKYVQELWQRQAQLVSKFGDTLNYFWVYPDDFMNGSYKHAEQMIEFCNLDFDNDVFNDWVEPEMWHNNG